MFIETRQAVMYSAFCLSLIFFLYQHDAGFSWDFATYSLNARYMLGDSTFFEWARPPLAPALMAAFGLSGMLPAEYLYIMFVSVVNNQTTLSNLS